MLQELRLSLGLLLQVFRAPQKSLEAALSKHGPRDPRGAAVVLRKYRPGLFQSSGFRWVLRNPVVFCPRGQTDLLCFFCFVCFSPFLFGNTGVSYLSRGPNSHGVREAPRFSLRIWRRSWRRWPMKAANCQSQNPSDFWV